MACTPARRAKAGGLDELLDDDVVFYSPIVLTPQRGKDLTTMYLLAAGRIPVNNDSADATAGEQARGDHRGTDAADGGEDAWDGRSPRLSRSSAATPRYSSSKPPSRASTSTGSTSSGATTKDGSWSSR
ncbi:MAG: hypothetical protein R2789_13055 [Microthrixaceae bacterium]